MQKPGYLPLPGISTRDPNFYDGANYSDQARFAHPVSSRPLPSPNVINIGSSRAGIDFDGIPEVESPSAGESALDTSAPSPSPFKLGGR